MKVLIEFFGTHRSVTKIDKVEMPINGGTHVRDAINFVRNKYPDLPIEEASIMVTVNHELASQDRLLRADDNVCILPHIGGG